MEVVFIKGDAAGSYGLQTTGSLSVGGNTPHMAHILGLEHSES